MAPGEDLVAGIVDGAAATVPPASHLPALYLRSTEGGFGTCRSTRSVSPRT
jgi:hypothetical protein